MEGSKQPSQRHSTFPRSHERLLTEPARDKKAGARDPPSACALCWRLTVSRARVRMLPGPAPGLLERGTLGPSPWGSPSLRGQGGATPESGQQGGDSGCHTHCPGLLLKPLDSSRLANCSPPCLKRRPMRGALGPLPAPGPASPFPRSSRDGRGTGAGVGRGDARRAGSQWEEVWALMDGTSDQWRGAGCTSRRGESVIWRRPTITCSSCC